ncbi:MAG: response regulator [Novosphingobium sp.]
MNKPLRVLAVDDSASMRALILHALTDRGFDVAQADDGLAALAWLETNEADVVITDINMPRLDGFGLIKRMRAGSRYRECPILVLSTESSDEKKRRARAAGATGWIVKPFDPAQLVAAVRRIAY